MARDPPIALCRVCRDPTDRCRCPHATDEVLDGIGTRGSPTGYL